LAQEDTAHEIDDDEDYEQHIMKRHLFFAFLAQRARAAFRAPSLRAAAGTLSQRFAAPFRPPAAPIVLKNAITSGGSGEACLRLAIVAP
jgi:hypothetical protein